MLNRLLSDNRIFSALVCVLVFIAAGLVYLNRVKHQAARDVQRTQEVVRQQFPPKTEAKPPPPGETAESGHWHGDEWHSEPHTPATPNTPTTPTAVTPQTQDAPSRPRQGPPAWASWDFQAAYQGLRERYSPADGNPPPFENVPVDLWDFEATKNGFMENFNFYREHYDPKEGWSHTRELRIAKAVMENIDNSAEPTYGLFTPEQCEEIHALYRDLRKFMGYISPIDQIMAEKGVTREVAIQMSIYEKLKSKGWRDEDIPAHYREAGK